MDVMCRNLYCSSSSFQKVDYLSPSSAGFTVPCCIRTKSCSVIVNTFISIRILKLEWDRTRDHVREVVKIYEYSS